MSELAPWESGDGRAPFHPEAPTQKVGGRRRAPGRLPEIYERQTEAIVVPSGNIVPRPQATPRPIEPRARMAMIVLGVAIFLGLAWAGLCFVIFGAEAGVLRIIYASVGLVLAAVAGLVLLLELPRMNVYRTGNFIPAVLVYGSKAQIEKVVGPMGIPPLTSNVAKGAGTGVLSNVFDRSARTSTPPEIVALHVNRGGTPELTGVEWDAVRELQRGDIVWYQPQGAKLLMFHKLVPYAPWVSQDEDTRKEVFEALRVGEIEYQDRPEQKAMGTTKVINTDVDGKLVVGGQSQPPQPRRGQNTKQLGLSAKGGQLGGTDQYDQTSDYTETADKEFETGLYRPPPKDSFRLSDPGKPLGGQRSDRPNQGDD